MKIYNTTTGKIETLLISNEYDWEDHIRRVNEILDEYLDV